MEDRAQAVGLFRYSLIREAASGDMSSRQRGQWVRELASETHLGPAGDRVRVSRNTLDRWIRAYRAGGFEALVPTPRHVEARTPGILLELAEALRIEEPARTASQIARIIAASKGWSPSARTIQRHLARAGLPWRGAQTPRAFGRFEAREPNELWTGDALHGPVVAGHKTYLCAFIDDFSGPSSAIGGATPRTRCAWKRRCAPAWRRGESHAGATWTFKMSPPSNPRLVRPARRG